MDQQIARLNVHWMTVTGSKVLKPKQILGEPDALRSLHRAICHVLLHAREALLLKLRFLLELCQQLHDRQSVSLHQIETDMERSTREGVALDGVGEGDTRRTNFLGGSSGKVREQEQEGQGLQEPGDEGVPDIFPG
ncbi:hypothetical protein PAAG_12504 [Paracoccidioides lutzii Pb01]|uniref:Uncharacterized protein n=1 Tax=Paracoccidioides lutzii (strain ATCC MYA-826 / Pb01) TaxID=502779 RepID=A0A0A2VIU0_PARBA|nr:hypothetical protein PAAG_12504 [Paracoccidioides lutzii Pb01]KGQ00839.1 hypothetical protein PAAG_12504 [Paracoccidioides lutzii Pb01]